MTNQPLKDKVAETANMATEKAKQGVAAAASLGREAGQAIKTEVKERVVETLETARDAAAAKADDARETLVDTGERLAQSLLDTADEASGLRARVLSGMASGVSTATGKLRNNSFADLGGQIRRYAHDNPGLFVAGAAVAGFALARFLASSPPGQSGADGGVERGPDIGSGQ